jgi:FkbM family methyltransferase
MKEIIHKILRKAGLRKFDTPVTLERIRKHNFQFDTVFDIGASDGRWSIEADKYLAASKYILIEANQQFESDLKQLSNKSNKFQYVIAAAGDANGDVYFEVKDLFGGAANSSATGGNLVKMTSIDSYIKEHACKGPFLVKLDTHGFEVPIIKGCLESMPQIEVFIIEAYNYRLTNDSLRFWELCSFMEDLGFLPFDIMEPTLRKHDSTFWQFDLVFARSDHNFFKYNKYK